MKCKSKHDRDCADGDDFGIISKKIRRDRRIFLLIIRGNTNMR